MFLQSSICVIHGLEDSMDIQSSSTVGMLAMQINLGSSTTKFDHKFDIMLLQSSICFIHGLEDSMNIQSSSTIGMLAMQINLGCSTTKETTESNLECFVSFLNISSNLECSTSKEHHAWDDVRTISIERKQIER